MTRRNWLAPIMTMAIAHPNSPTSAPTLPSEVAQTALQNLEQRNLAGVERLLADKVRFENKFHLPGMPALVEGREAVVTSLSVILALFERVEFVDKHVIPGQNGRTVYIEAQGNFALRDTGEPYRNTYIFVFEIEQGRIIYIREYNNPLVLAATLNIPLK